MPLFETAFIMICYIVSLESGNGRNVGQPSEDCKQTHTAAIPETEGRLRFRETLKRGLDKVLFFFKHLSFVCGCWYEKINARNSTLLGGKRTKS